MENTIIRPVNQEDAEAICGIYNEYVLNSRITFEEAPVSTDEMRSRIADIIADYPWIVCEQEGKIVGYAYASKWKERSAYRYSVEAGIYLDRDHLGEGLGSELTAELIRRLTERSMHSLICGIALPNPASIALCEKFGFEQVAHFKEVGFKMGIWVDVGYWELLL